MNKLNNRVLSFENIAIIVLKFTYSKDKFFFKTIIFDQRVENFVNKNFLLPLLFSQCYKSSSLES